MDVKLVVQTPEREGREIPIDREEFVIGRDYSCHHRLTHPDIGLRHCRIRREGDRVLVEDLDSATGTEVNGRAIGTDEVRHGDRLQVGCESFLISITAGSDGEPGPDGLRGVDGGWVKLCVAEGRGIAVVSFADIALINELEIQEVDRELSCLIEMGYNRIALNLVNVVHMSSQVIGTVLKFFRRCTSDGGMLKICQIHPNILEIFAITGVYLKIEIYPDVHTVLESHWPEPTRRPVLSLKPPPASRNGVHAAAPRRGAGIGDLPAAPADPRDDPASAIPLDDLFAPGLRPAPAPRPVSPAPAQANGAPPKRGGGSGPRPAPPEDPTAAIPLDDALSSPPPHASPGPRPVPAARPAPLPAKRAGAARAPDVAGVGSPGTELEFAL